MDLPVHDSTYHCKRWKRSFVGACLASPAAWILAGGLLIFMYFKVVREQEKVFGESVQVKNEKI